MLFCTAVSMMLLAATAHASEQAGEQLGSASSVQDLIGGSNPALAGPTRLARDCQRWRAISARLGETYAGHRFRRAIIEPSCDHEAPPRGTVVWSWPWRDGSIAPELPPVVRSSFGPWVIRCQRAAMGHRCALLSSQRAQGDAGGGPEIVTHFVIDTIAGRESVLWRVLVRPMARTAPAAKRIELVDGGTHRPLRFEACGAAGCLMEADIATASGVVRRLAAGEALRLELPARRGHRYKVTIEAAAFAAAFAELNRLHNAEPVQQAEHGPEH